MGVETARYCEKDVGKLGLLSVAAGLALAGWTLVRPAVPRSVTPAVWPATEIELAVLPLRFPDGFGQRRVFVDAGHGAPGNSGNRSAFCRDEQDFTLELAEDLGERLERTGRFSVRLSRSADQRIPYPDRVREAQAWLADALVSLHSDVRGHAESWEPEPGQICSRARDAPGFSVLWSDEGEPEPLGQRNGLARALATELERTGLLAYGGAEYGADYAADGKRTGVFVDRHRPGERIFVLRSSAMPAVIVETHNALDDREAARWQQPRTREAFASAVAAALIGTLADRLTPPAGSATAAPRSP